jgi:hypothetical protein
LIYREKITSYHKRFAYSFDIWCGMEISPLNVAKCPVTDLVCRFSATTKNGLSKASVKASVWLVFVLLSECAMGIYVNATL